MPLVLRCPEYQVTPLASSISRTKDSSDSNSTVNVFKFDEYVTIGRSIPLRLCPGTDSPVTTTGVVPS